MANAKYDICLLFEFSAGELISSNVIGGDVCKEQRDWLGFRQKKTYVQMFL